MHCGLSFHTIISRFAVCYKTVKYYVNKLTLRKPDIWISCVNVYNKYAYTLCSQLNQNNIAWLQENSNPKSTGSGSVAL